jgi:hypothetical protein
MQSLTHSCVVPRVCVQRTPNALNPIAGEAEGSDKKRRKAAPKPKAKAKAEVDEEDDEQGIIDDAGESEDEAYDDNDGKKTNKPKAKAKRKSKAKAASGRGSKGKKKSKDSDDEEDEDSDSGKRGAKGGKGKAKKSKDEEEEEESDDNSDGVKPSGNNKRNDKDDRDKDDGTGGGKGGANRGPNNSGKSGKGDDNCGNDNSDKGHDDSSKDYDKSGDHSGLDDSMDGGVRACTSGVTGVSWVPQIESWKAEFGSWYKTFSVAQHGFDKAKQLAIAMRRQFEASANASDVSKDCDNGVPGSPGGLSGKETARRRWVSVEIASKSGDIKPPSSSALVRQLILFLFLLNLDSSLFVVSACTHACSFVYYTCLVRIRCCRMRSCLTLSTQIPLLPSHLVAVPTHLALFNAFAFCPLD